MLGALALVVSGTAVLHRVSATQKTRLRSVRSDNLTRVEADKALTGAKEALAAALAAAEAECRSGRGARCMRLEQREKAARQRVVEARAKLIEPGTHAVADPGAQYIAAFFPILASTYQHIAAALLPVSLELTAPLLFSLAVAPSRRQVKSRRKRRKRKVRIGQRPVPGLRTLKLKHGGSVTLGYSS